MKVGILFYKEAISDHIQNSNYVNILSTDPSVQSQDLKRQTNHTNLK